ncbi:hypothetical protein [Actinoallomurus acaciae]|uniref:Uncharacterized protein n=1 Tax=Actinoallomurus acaciae TaxID=502577 RepID=A0ABV5YMM4_9ACTN
MHTIPTGDNEIKLQLTGLGVGAVCGLLAGALLPAHRDPSGGVHTTGGSPTPCSPNATSCAPRATTSPHAPGIWSPAAGCRAVSHVAGTTSAKQEDPMNDLSLRPPQNRVERRAIGWWTAQSSPFALPLPVVLAVLYLTIPPARPGLVRLVAGRHPRPRTRLHGRHARLALPGAPLGDHRTRCTEATPGDAV